MKKDLCLVEGGFVAYPALTLRQLAIQTDCTYNVLLREAHRPIVGVAYDPEAINFPAIEAAMVRKLGRDAYEAIDYGAIAEHLEIRVAKQTEWLVGDTVTFRNFGGTFNVVLSTTTHAVFQEVGGTQPRVMSWDTFNHQGPKKVTVTE